MSREPVNNPCRQCWQWPYCMERSRSMRCRGFMTWEEAREASGYERLDLRKEKKGDANCSTDLESSTATQS